MNPELAGMTYVAVDPGESSSFNFNFNDTKTENFTDTVDFTAITSPLTRCIHLISGTYSPLLSPLPPAPLSISSMQYCLLQQLWINLKALTI